MLLTFFSNQKISVHTFSEIWLPKNGLPWAQVQLPKSFMRVRLQNNSFTSFLDSYLVSLNFL